MKSSERAKRRVDDNKVLSYRRLASEHQEQKLADSAANSDEAPKRDASGFFAVLLGILILIGVAVWLLPIFHVQEIVVQGASGVDRELLIDRSGIEIGDHLFRSWGGSPAAYLGLRYKEAEEQVMAASPYVRIARVRMSFPGKVVIGIEEREPTSYLALEDDSYMLLDREGYVLEIKDGAKPLGIPMIEGMLVRAAKTGEKVQVNSVASIDTALNLIDTMIRADRAADDSFSILSHITEIRVPGDDNPYLRIKLIESETQIHAKLGTQDRFDDALNWLRYTLQTKKLEGLGEGVLDLSGDDYIFVRDVEEGR